MADCSHYRSMLDSINNKIGKCNDELKKNEEVKSEYTNMQEQFDSAMNMLKSYASSLETIGCYLQGVIINDLPFDKGECFSNATEIRKIAQTFEEATNECKNKLIAIEENIKGIKRTIKELERQYGAVLAEKCSQCEAEAAARVAAAASAANKVTTPASTRAVTKSVPSPGSSGGCFAAGTKIYTEVGFKNIEDIIVGDKVLSYNINTGTLEYKAVKKVFKRMSKNNLYLINVGKTEIKVTENHMFYVKMNDLRPDLDSKIYNHDENNNWLEAKRIRRNTKLFTSSFKYLNVEKIENIVGNEYVYNFKVECNHNYFVTEDRILVHNRKMELM